MNYIRITVDNIDKEHICCAMSNKQSVVKKQWLKQRFDEGLVFYRSEERGKCFIEYIPAENAWVPIIAEGYIYINCLWVSGSMKGHGYSNDLLDALAPETACISVGSNRYGHPADETIRRLAEHGCAVYRTDMQGSIHLTLNRGD